MSAFTSKPYEPERITRSDDIRVAIKKHDDLMGEYGRLRKWNTGLTGELESSKKREQLNQEAIREVGTKNVELVKRWREIEPVYLRLMEKEKKWAEAVQEASNTRPSDISEQYWSSFGWGLIQTTAFIGAGVGLSIAAYQYFY